MGSSTSEAVVQLAKLRSLSTERDHNREAGNFMLSNEKLKHERAPLYHTDMIESGFDRLANYCSEPLILVQEDYFPMI